jgi:hypothetical protein
MINELHLGRIVREKLEFNYEWELFLVKPKLQINGTPFSEKSED